MKQLEAKWVHMIGIGGAGMSGIAMVLKENGYQVSGSDLKLSSVTERLEKIGIRVYEGHRSEQLAREVDTVVYSSAVPASNSELVEARVRGLAILGRGQMLALLANSHRAISIAGAHGKTTTTSMIATVLLDSGLDPSFITGGELQSNGMSAYTGRGDYFVLEADESDGSFLELFPFISVVTNVEDDHLDHYKSLQALQSAFAQFLAQTREGGMAVICGDDPFLQNAVIPEQVRRIRYGLDESMEYSLRHWQAEGTGSRFEVLREGRPMGWLELAIPGKHNGLNALAAVAVATELGADFGAIKSSLKKFKGARRRFDVLLEGPVTVVDDYAHHPTEIQATILAACQCEHQRLVAAFQPHRYSRTRQLGSRFGGAFVNADLVVISGIYSAGEKPEEGITGEIIHQAAVESGVNSRYIADMENVELFLKNELKPGDLLLMMGAGDIWKAAYNLAEHFGKKPE